MPRKTVIEILRELGWSGNIELDTEYSQESTPSGGERKRIGVARAILSKPAITIVDEIEAGLDNPIALIQVLCKYNHTVLTVTHNPELWQPYNEKWSISPDCTLIIHQYNEIDLKSALSAQI